MGVELHQLSSHCQTDDILHPARSSDIKGWHLIALSCGDDGVWYLTITTLAYQAVAP